MEKLQKNLTENGFECLVAKDKKEALELSKKFIKDNLTIGLGGSTTVDQIGLLEYLISLKNITLFNQYENGISMEENTKRRRNGLFSDLYITSTNAITQCGKLVNADGNGNRVAAQIFGPKKVLIIAGTNKIVNDVNDAFKRIKEVAAAKNIKRMNDKAISLGKEPRFNLKNIATKWTIIDSDEKNRTTIILVEEELGF